MSRRETRIMTMRPTSAPSGRLARALAIVAPLVAGAALPTGLAAAEPAGGQGASFGQNGDVGTRRMDLSIGRSVVVDLPRDAKEVFVANPGVANAVVRSARKIFLIGIANGATSVFAMDADGRQIASIEVNVGRDLNVLRQTLRTAIPSARIDIRPAGDSILLTGNVASAGDAQQAVDIARAFVGQGGGGAPAAGGAVAGGAVINAITINGRDQVMLKVTVVEMARSALKQLGVNLSGNWNLLQVAGGAFSPGVAPAATTLNSLVGTFGGTGSTVGGSFPIGNGNSSLGGTLSALERAGVSRLLAEPTLVAISGESATFLAGGEIPIIISTCGGGGSTGCVPTLTYKPYGVSLSFTPVVLTEGRISLHVSTEVSEIDRDNQDAVTRSPGFRTRKTTTSIELPSGATMVTAGLISSQSSQTISGVPGLINLPILGTLFRSRDFQRRDSELMVMVTPFIAKPMEAAQAKRPDDGFADANDPQTILLGRLNKIYGVAGPGAPVRGYGGRVGFITD